MPDELAKSFGFFNSKPATAFPVAVTPNELGAAWQNGRAHVRRDVDLQPRGAWSANRMHFSFYELIRHA